LQNGDPPTARNGGGERREAGLNGQTGMDGHFNAFTFVNRITGLQPGTSVRGSYFIPPHIGNFSQSLAGEAVGQLAAWAAMAAVNFKRRPVAGIAGKIELLSPVRPGQTLDLHVQLESIDEEAAAYQGEARADGIPVVRLQNCVGPMLPAEDFDDPQLLREHFALLRGNGSKPGGFGGISALEFSRNGGETGKSAHATLQVPASAPFFADHFPRRPVFPGTLLMNLNLQLAAALAAEIPGRWELKMVSDVKLRSFIPPGEQLGLEAKLGKHTENSITVMVETRREKKLAGSARVSFALGGNS
jgi:3-hydroxymyristoyl/3-hydroxydecanoyl-(acyl carrier protein) dehydratase